MKIEHIILFLPLISAIISGFFGKRLGERSSEIITSVFVSISLRSQNRPQAGRSGAISSQNSPTLIFVHLTTPPIFQKKKTPLMFIYRSGPDWLRDAGFSRVEPGIESAGKKT